MSKVQKASTLQCSKCGDMIERFEDRQGRTTCPRCSGPSVDADPAAEPAHRTMGFLAALMPWVISGLFHISVGMVLLFIVVIVMAADEPTVVTRPVDVTQPPSDTIFEVMEQESLQKDKPDAARRGDIRDRSGDVVPQAKPVEPTKLDVFTRGLAVAPMGKTTGGKFLGTSIDAITRGEGPRAPQTPGGSAHIVYVLDRSGSMIDTFDRLRWNLAESFGTLTNNEGTTFHVIFFAAGRPLENHPRKLVVANKANLSDAVKWLAEVSAEGQTDPIPAIERAFAVLAGARDNQPKIIHLLTDGMFPDNEKVLRTIRRLNKNNRVHVCTFLYGNRPPEAVEVMQRIADETNAAYRYVSLDE